MSCFKKKNLNETNKRENLFPLKQVPKETSNNHIFEQVVE